jgi:hypothetical protein
VLPWRGSTCLVSGLSSEAVDGLDSLPLQTSFCPKPRKERPNAAGRIIWFCLPLLCDFVAHTILVVSAADNRYKLHQALHVLVIQDVAYLIISGKCLSLKVRFSVGLYLVLYVQATLIREHLWVSF